jgi:hypothetical protein
MAGDIPDVDWSGMWTTLRGYIQDCVTDDKPVPMVEVAAYMDKLRSDAMAPVEAWMDDIKREARENIHAAQKRKAEREGR